MNCFREKCPGQALWRPVLKLRASAKTQPVRATFTEVALCERHKDQATLADFMSPSSWDKLVRFMREAGKPAPKKSLTVVEYDLLQNSPPDVLQSQPETPENNPQPEDLPF